MVTGMSTEELVIGLAALVVAAVYLTIGKLSKIVNNKHTVAFDKYEEYKPYAMMAAKWAEERISDALPDNATTLEKSLNKLDVYLKKFITIVEIKEGTPPSVALIKAAKVWSMELAEEMNYRKAAKEAMNGKDTDGTVPASN